MRNWFLLVTISGLLLLFAGCPQGQKQDPDANGTAGALAPDSGTAPQQADAGQPAANSSAVPAVPAATGSADKPAGASALHGEWLALFGRQDEGMLADAWQQDQRIKFDKQGQVVFTLSLKGKMTQVQGSYLAGEDGAIKLSLSAADAVGSGLSHVAPLGIGRNEEVGLLKQAGRNEEIGLVDSSTPDAAGNITRSVTYKVYGDYLALTDQFDHVMIYARYVQAEPVAADFSGAWTAKFGTLSDIAATATSTGDAVSIDLGQAGKFDGKLVSGVAVGKIKRANEIILATLQPEADGSLAGLYLTAPYLELLTDLTLTRAN